MMIDEDIVIRETPISAPVTSAPPQGAPHIGRKKPVLKNSLVIILFVLFLITPWAAMELHLVSAVNYENRTLAQKPDMFDPRGYENYLNDNFAFKNSLVAVDCLYKRIFKTSSSNQVVLGEDGWLFYTVPDAPEWDPIATYMGLNRFSDEQLLLLKDKFVCFDQRLKEIGTDFFLVIPPNKHTVYSEYLPKYVRERAKETRMAQLIDYLQMNSDVKVIDLRGALDREHDQYQIYYKTDTHWNSYGAYIAYTEIFRAVGMESFGRNDYSISPKEVSAMDMARMAGSVTATDLQFDFVLANRSPEPELIEGELDSDKVAVYTNHDPMAPSLMIYHDSYNVALLPFLTPHFSRTISSWKLFPDAREIEEQAPDYVIFEILERNLEYLFNSECLKVS